MGNTFTPYEMVIPIHVDNYLTLNYIITIRSACVRYEIDKTGKSCLKFRLVCN